jgi:hypothetical protein
MELFIRIVDGQPYEHPILGDNFCEAFPEIDTNNLPSEFARFERVPMPSLVYATLNNPNPAYQWVDGIVKDVWDITPMTQEEKNAKIASVVQPYPSWNFYEPTCSYIPPAECPTDGKRYYWNEPTLSWVELTV